MQAPEIDWRYVRMSVSARRKLADFIRDKRRECYKGRMVKYTQTTIGLLNAVLERIDRATGSARIAYSILHEITGIASAETLERHIFLLETAGCVKVNRGKAGWNRNAINEFVLIGETARSFLGEGWTPNKAKNRSDITTIIVGNLTKNNDDGTDTLDSNKDLVDKLKTILDGDVAERLANQHDCDYLERLYNWVIAQEWANSKGGLFMTKLRAKWNPPMEGEKTQTKKQRAGQHKTAWRTQEDDWQAYMVDADGKPVKTGWDVTPPPPQPIGIDYRAVNVRIGQWWNKQPFVMGNHVRLMMVMDKGGALGYHPTGWAKRGGVETLRGLLREWYPEQAVELVEIVQSVAVA